MRIVAPHTGAWIETIRWLWDNRKILCRTSYGCVNWNRVRLLLIIHHKTSHLIRVRELKLFTIKYIRKCMSRTSYGCVNWNYCTEPTYYHLIVAPHTGAWIETVFSGERGGLGKSRTSYGCVNWNFVIEKEWLNEDSRTSYGCVNWNN